MRVGMVGAGAMGRAITLQIARSVPGMEVAAISNRTPGTAEEAYRGAGFDEVAFAENVRSVEASVAAGRPVITDDAGLVCAAEGIDVVLEVTGAVDFGAGVVLDAIGHGKHVVTMNAELQGTLGPLLKAKADQAGVVLTDTDGDQPGVLMNLIRFVQGIGVRPVLAGNLKGLHDPYRNPTTQEGFAEARGLTPNMATSFADGTKMSFEMAIVANATGMRVARRGMHGPDARSVHDAANLFDLDELLEHPIVDYLVGAEPAPGVFVLGYEEHPVQRAFLDLYKLGEGPLYTFYRPYHLCHFEVPSTIARAVLFGDATIAPLREPRVDVVAAAKRDLDQGHVLDGIGFYDTYGLSENSGVAARANVLPMGLAEGCRLKRSVTRDEVLSYDDVEVPEDRVSDRLWAEQSEWRASASNDGLGPLRERIDRAGLPLMLGAASMAGLLAAQEGTMAFAALWAWEAAKKRKTRAARDDGSSNGLRVREPQAEDGRSPEPDRSVKTCIVCASRGVEPVLDLGETALANRFLTEAQLDLSEPRYPLVMGFCHECGHVQLVEQVPPSEMFEDYLYVSSVSDSLKSHLYDLSDVVSERYSLGADDLVIDIGCNDGTLLQGFRRHGVRALGVDPAKNLAELFDDPAIDRYTGFFDSRSAVEICERWGPASAVTATNTFPHIPELRDFVQGVDTVLAPGGVFTIEAHYLVDLLDQLAFDTIYHEHVSYWALGPMIRLFSDHGMQVVRAERLPLHHGQLRAFVQRRRESEVHPSVDEVLATERDRGLDRFETYRRFADRTLRVKQDLRCVIGELRSAGNRVVGYGAPAKGNTLLGFLELGPGDLDYIADKSPLKQGRYTPGTHIPVVPVERLLGDQPDYVLILAWNFADEVMEQQAEYRRRGGRFILPLPEVRILS